MFVLKMCFCVIYRSGLYPDFYPDEMCKNPKNITKHDPPLLYDLNHDPGELNPLRTTRSPYKEILAEINQVSLIKYMQL